MLSGSRFSFPISRSTTLSVIPSSADALHVPSPCRRARIELDQALGGQCGQELDYKEGIARGLLMHQPRERLGEGTLLTDAVGDKLAHIVERQRGEHDVPHHHALVLRIESSVSISGWEGLTSLSR